jgi:hypothetical protein
MVSVETSLVTSPDEDAGVVVEEVELDEVALLALALECTPFTGPRR